MTTDVYERLAKHLDDLPAGFPRTENGVEMRILQQLFTPEEAELAVHLSLIEEGAAVIACGFSCRHQIAHGTGVKAIHWVETVRGKK